MLRALIRGLWPFGERKLAPDLWLDDWRRLVTTAFAATPYLTPAKLVNLLRCELEKWGRVARPRAFPYLAVADVANICNLHCPYCPTGARRSSGRARKLIDPLLVERLLDELDKYLLSVNLFNWGEPLLHPKIAPMVKMIHARRIFTKISTNLNTSHRQTLAELVEAGLDYLTVSVAGASQAVYEQYHRGGSLEAVWENIRYLSAFKQRHGLRRPLVEFKYLLFKHNRQEMPAARQMAYGLGVEIFRCETGGGPEEAIIADSASGPPQALFPKFCHQLWNMVVLNSDGGLAPCCFLFFRKDDFGVYGQEPFRQARNNPMFVTARQLFNAKEAATLPVNMRHPCLKCQVVHAQPHLQAYLALNPHARQDHRTGGP
jgi:organic radical activating enzyme